MNNNPTVKDIELQVAKLQAAILAKDPVDQRKQNAELQRLVLLATPEVREAFESGVRLKASDYVQLAFDTVAVIKRLARVVRFIADR